MPFCRARLSAKRLIAGVGGNVPWPLPIAAPSKGGPPAAPPSLSSPMMRSATSHTASIAPTISCLPTTTSSSRHSSCAVTPGSNQGWVGLFENAEQRQAGFGRYDVLSLGNQETLFLQPADDLRSGRRRAYALGLLQALPQNLIVNKAQGILHRLDQSAFVITRRWSGLLVLDFRIVQLRNLAVAQRRQQLRSAKAKPPQSGGLKECHAIPPMRGRSHSSVQAIRTLASFQTRSY